MASHPAVDDPGGIDGRSALGQIGAVSRAEVEAPEVTGADLELDQHRNPAADPDGHHDNAARHRLTLSAASSASPTYAFPSTGQVYVGLRQNAAYVELDLSYRQKLPATAQQSPCLAGPARRPTNQCTRPARQQ